MAACNLGTLNIKISNLNFGRRRAGSLQFYNLRTSAGQRPLQYAGCIISRSSKRLLSVCRGSSLETLSATTLEDSSEENKYSGSRSQLIPNFDEVESLLTKICDTTSIAEFELKLGGFRLHLLRDLTGKISTASIPSPVPVSASTTAEEPASNGSVSSESLAIMKPPTSSRDIQTMLDNPADEGLVIIRSPRVGFFRRSRTIKGKRAPPPCQEKQVVEEGKVICFVEQLGGELPIESDVTGEVIKILVEDGDPVGYNDALIAILPSFPGIKLQ
ncbi:hypothetical protein FEM48_Zijuj01G0302500 [Ziziphus jujuba var. spinosa]|uniref:Lipoyl-binding domain-containing protein n=1 Tax=Ziziphus jujuba var. spinosa TaxID=714518 RepID=A0A978W5Y6_ZIZJJ|nr:hypothetical protein FEM48_Zijuj01G0302500 [Ziziphus jujuba var. spinosa]